MTKVMRLETFIIFFLTTDSVKIYPEKKNSEKYFKWSSLFSFLKLVIISTKWFCLDWVFQQRSHKTESLKLQKIKWIKMIGGFQKLGKNLKSYRELLQKYEHK